MVSDIDGLRDPDLRRHARRRGVDHLGGAELRRGMAKIRGVDFATPRINWAVLGGAAGGNRLA